MTAFYSWLYPKAGGFAIYKMVEDYEAEKKAGYSTFPDHRDLDNMPVYPVAESPAEKAKYTCDVCGKEVKSPLALAGHKRSHK